MVAFDANTLVSNTAKENLENTKSQSINDWEVALVLVCQVCFGGNRSEIKFQTVTSGMQIGEVFVQNHVLVL